MMADDDKNLIQYTKTTDILADVKSIIDASRNKAYHAVNIALLQQNWLLGKRIAEEELA